MRTFKIVKMGEFIELFPHDMEVWLAIILSIKLYFAVPLALSTFPLYSGDRGGNTKRGISLSAHTFSKSVMNSDPPST